MGSKKIVVVKAIMDEDNKEKINEIAERYGYTVSYFTNNNDAMEAIADAEIIYGMGPALIKHSPQLQWFCSAAAGVNNILIDGLAANPDYQLTCATGAYGLTISEHIIMVSLMMMRQMPEYVKTTAKKQWAGGLTQRSLAGSRILVIGTGDIGTRFAERAKAFGPEMIIGINRSGKVESDAYDVVATMDRLNDFLPQTDLVVMALPETKETIGVMNRERFALMNQDAYLVNVGRGTAIDQEALMEALNDDVFAGAALDVFEVEPLEPDNPIWDTKNLLITPHISGQETLKETRDKNVGIFCEDLINYCEGRPLKYLVDKELGYQAK